MHGFIVPYLRAAELFTGGLRFEPSPGSRGRSANAGLSACVDEDRRVEKPLRTAADELGVSRDLLSEVERRRRLPTHAWIALLEETYGAPALEWYKPAVLLALLRGAKRGCCSRCIFELLPDRIAEIHWRILVGRRAGVHR